MLKAVLSYRNMASYCNIDVFFYYMSCSLDSVIMSLCRLSEWPVLMSVWSAFLLNGTSEKRRKKNNWLNWFPVCKWSFLLCSMIHNSPDPVFTFLTGGVRFVKRLLLSLFYYINWHKSKLCGHREAGRPPQFSPSRPCEMFQIFVCWTAFCVLPPIPLWGGTAHVGFQLKPLQYTLPCVIALRFCTSRR